MGLLLSIPSVRYPKPPSCLDSARASHTSRDGASSSTSNRGSGGQGVIMRGRQFPKRRGGLIPQDGSTPFKPSVRYPKPPYCLESARAFPTASNSASASTSHCCSGVGGLIPSGHQVPDQSGGLFPQDRSLHFEPSVRSPKPPSCLESARASLTASNSASANTSDGGRGGGGVSLSRQRFPDQSRGLLPQYLSLCRVF